MNLKRHSKKTIYRTIRDYGIITVGMLLGAVGLTLFLLPNEITTGGIMGIASIIYWGTGIPVQETYFVMNALLIAAALKVLGWRFCAKTIYAVSVFTLGVFVLQHMVDPKLHLLADQKFMACIVGGVFLGTSVGLGLSAGGSTGGSDVVAGVGKKDQILEVNDGYARNFLIPKKLGVQASTANLALLKSKQDSRDFKRQEDKKEAEQIKEKLEKIRLDIKVKSGENGKIFGGVTSKEISDVLKDKYSINIDKKKIELKETIKTVGITTVDIKLFEGVIGKVKVNVIPEK